MLTSLSPQGGAHRSTSDDLYNGYHIPTNSIIIPNQWWLWSPSNRYWIFLHSQISTFIGQCRMTNRTIQNRTYSSPSDSWRMDSPTIRLETQWTLHLGSVGGVHYIIVIHVFFSNIAFLVEFARGNISLIQLSHSLLRPFCLLLTWWEKWTRMVKKCIPRWNILNFHCGKFHFSVLALLI